MSEIYLIMFLIAIADCGMIGILVGYFIAESYLKEQRDVGERDG